MKGGRVLLDLCKESADMKTMIAAAACVLLAAGAWAGTPDLGDHFGAAAAEDIAAPAAVPPPARTGRRGVQARSDMPSASELRREGDRPIFWRPPASRVPERAPAPGELPASFTELAEYVLPSPNQEDAGSCLYMAVTGIAEWWLGRRGGMPGQSDGAGDLSERYAMSLSGSDEAGDTVADWRTDTIRLFNINGQRGMKNTSYRYTKGWYRDLPDGGLAPAAQGGEGASYGTRYNWIAEVPENGEYVSLPRFEREILFADPEHNQWNVGVAPEGIVETVKRALVEKNAPVLVIYNHNRYWHAVYVIGYDDGADHGGCLYTENFRKRIAKSAAELQKAADEATDPGVKKSYEAKARRARAARDKLEAAYAKNGGCTRPSGGFLVRDSIYPDTGGPVYDYDLSGAGEEAPYAKRIVVKEYDWLNYFANHVMVVTAS